MRDRLLRLATTLKSNRLYNRWLRYNPLYYPDAARYIAASATLDRDGRLRQRDMLTEQALTWAQKTPYGAGHSLEFATWPILEKSLLRTSNKPFLSPALLGVPASTSGSAGIPIRLERNLKNLAVEQAFLDTLLHPFDLSFATAKIVILRGDFAKPAHETEPPFGRYMDDHRLVMSCPHLNGTTLDWYYQELKKFRPDVLWILPSGGDLLATLLVNAGYSLPIPIILSASEMLPVASWNLYNKAFEQPTVIDHYGQAERVAFAVQHIPDQGYFNPAYGRIELQPDNAVTRDDGLAEADIIATGYWNKRMPLIRYATGDRIAYPAHYTVSDLEDVSLGIKPFTRIIGRREEHLITPHGGRIQGLNNIPREMQHTIRVQFIQDTVDHVEVRVLHDGHITPVDIDCFMHHARLKIPPDIAIDVYTDRPLITTANSKTPFVVRSQHLD